ncbi:SUMF1/EgtB/PvdO family nonheme iron enzyme [bacterium]|nr:SUMF1/EgtB/PvdO family nonheme iron enzyme [bacterium]
MVFDSRQAEVARQHRSLVQLLKEKRAEAHFAGIQLEQTISVYDHAVPAHAGALQNLGLSRGAVPMLCLVQLNQAGIPSQVLWKSTYDNPDVVLKALDLRLGIADRDRPKVPPLLILAGSQTDPAWLETHAKLKTLLDHEWKAARIQSYTQAASLAEVPAPGLALVDAGNRKLLWKKDLSAPDSTLHSLSSQLGLVYKAPDVLLWEKDGSTLMRVSGGLVSVGSDDPERPDDCKPRHTFELKTSYYYVGKTEVTVAQFRRFVEATHHQTDAEKAGRSFVFQGGGFTPVPGANWRCPKGAGSTSPDNFPVVHITYNDALAYAGWAGLRLPNEREWEHAAGAKNFPWGDQWNASACRNSVGLAAGASGGPAAVGSFHQGASPWGCLDMAGNVYEWTDSIYQRYTDKSPPSNSRMNGLRRVIRGGSFGNDEVKDFWTTTRTPVGSQDSTEAQGFRVCLDGTRP